MKPNQEDRSRSEQRLLEIGSAYKSGYRMHTGVKFGVFGPLVESVVRIEI